MLNRQVPFHWPQMVGTFFKFVDFLSFLTETRERFKRLVVPVRDNENVDVFITEKTLFYLKNRPN